MADELILATWQMPSRTGGDQWQKAPTRQAVWYFLRTVETSLTKRSNFRNLLSNSASGSVPMLESQRSQCAPTSDVEKV
jgi:hypothetical protein